MALTAKQSRFVEEYLVDLNATQAAIRAGYSEKTAGRMGSENLSKPDIAAAISKAQESRSKRTEVTQDMVVAELAKIGFADIRKAVNWGKTPISEGCESDDPNGLRIYPVELVASEDIDDDTAAAVSEVSLTQTGIKVKMYDKKGALDSLARHLGMFTEKVEHTSPDGSMTPQPSMVSKGPLEDCSKGWIACKGGGWSDHRLSGWIYG